MKASLKNIIAVLALANVYHLNAQQNSLYNTYSLDPLQLNIAYAGAACTEANLHYRTQWINMKEAPKVFQVNAHTALGKSNGLGLRVQSQSYGLLNLLGATFGYSYKVKLSEVNKLHLGLGIGFSQATLNGSKANVVDAGDITLNNNNKQTAGGFDSEFGAIFIGNKLKAGISALHLYNSNPNFAGNSAYKTLPQFNTQVSYILNKDRKFEVEPWLLSRYTVKGNNIIEAMVNVKYNKILLLGAGYRSNYGLLVLLGAKIGNLRLGYSFDYGTGNNATNLGTSHQIMLGFSLCRAAKPTLPAEEPTAVKEETVSPSPVVTDMDKKPEEPVKQVPEIKEEPVKVEPVKEEPVKIEPKKEEPIVKQEPKVEVAKQDETIPKSDALVKINKIAEEVLFEFNQSQLTNEELMKIEKIASTMKQSPELKINIIGHTCNIGTKEVNDLISIRRATYVRNELIKRGVNPKNINRSIGVGAEKELFNNSTEENQRKNRTVRFESTD